MMKEISLHILDIAENSIRAEAKRVRIAVRKDQGNKLSIQIHDDGKGMDREELKRSMDPFYTSRTTRKVGLGIPLLRQHAEMTGGSVEICSEPGAGTVIKAVFQTDHPDSQPLGDLEGSWLILASLNPDIDWDLKLGTEQGEFQISSQEIKQELGISQIQGSDLTASLKRLIRNNIEELQLD